MEMIPVLPGINREMVTFVMDRWQASGGFGFAPTLPASVEDTYHAIRILETIRPVSDKEVRGLKENPLLKDFLTGVEDKETWSLRTVFQYAFLCGFCRSPTDQRWIAHFLENRLKESVSLRDLYYMARIQRECPESSPADYGESLDQGASNHWRTAEELWMRLYLHEGSPEALHTTRERLIEWVQACQTPDGGFGALPGTTSFIENSHWCLSTLTMLRSVPLSSDMARDFILRCKTRGGGFARKNGAAPFLYATWHAVDGLSLLNIMSEGRLSDAFPSPL